ncbi:MAG TPA: chromosome segregation protein SMC [Idiomarina abyssalis]|jgi:predicted ATP-dependent endonuclease of OLD family|uniref:ATP-dependent nuclease n=1 Tax=Idiomarina TaxID=135575 RepID=UPI000C4D4A28|nr:MULTISPECIES: AAA family ATPase [Idiomarina]MAB20742.1 chromosome segregation protein SMC [Idiomarina sp.]MBH95113.1 chromosome segregation protein SMC [Idiomarina sp.]HAS14840.1 chromosome segregation protein SMC [Idiomarina abyssalis]|tara:strand:+ start:195 stop:1811 length:1617 start_codon:yes stop_codon:yes gene_type:complete
MKISRVCVDNFRSIGNAEFDCSNFNVFVGQNNAGKTNFFEAIEWFFNGLSKNKSIKDLHPNRDTNKEISVEVKFSGAQHGAQNMRNEGNREKMLKVLDGSDTLIVRRTSLEPTKRKLVIEGVELERNPAGFDKAFNDFLPKFEYIHTKQYFDEVAKYSAKSPIGIMLSSVLEEILHDNPQYREFRKKFDELFDDDGSQVKVEFDRLGGNVKTHLEKQFAECTKVSFEVSSPEFEDLLKNFQTRVDDGVETYASEKGDGMQRALMLAIIQAYAEYRKDREEAGKSFLFFIDEAELHLHPTAQRKLKDVLLELCEDLDQVFLNTHSSVFVADDHPDQTIYKVEKEESITGFRSVDALDKPYVVFELLGGSPSDLLLPRNFLIVEGPSEVELLTRVIRRFYSDKPAIQVIAAEGDTHQARRSINAIKKSFKPLENSMFEEKMVVLCDAPTQNAQAGFDDFLREFKSFNDRGQIKVLERGSLEECYPNFDDWNRTEQQVSDMSGKQKTKLSKRVGDHITKEQFENEMKSVFETLVCAWERAF